MCALGRNNWVNGDNLNGVKSVQIAQHATPQSGDSQ